MKTYRVKSNKYSKKAIQFGSFVLKFDSEGIAQIDLNDTDGAKFAKIVEAFKPTIFYLEEDISLQLEAEKEKNVDFLKKTIEDKDTEIKTLKISIKDISNQNTQLAAEIKALKQLLSAKEETYKKETTKTDSKVLKEELNKKTVVELKELLSVSYEGLEDEWKGLSKKEEIVNYMVEKAIA